MQNKFRNSGLLIMTCFLLMTSCKKNTFFTKLTDSSKDFVHRHLLTEVRLGDGVPLELNLSVRWKVSDFELFSKQFSKADSFNIEILHPRTLELVRTISNNFPSVDSVFSPHRQKYISDVKEVLLSNLGENGVTIKEVILSKIDFPKSYTDAMVEAGLQRQELERIRQRNIIDLEQAEANKKKAAADGLVDIAKAESEGRLQKIKAKTEESRRASELAKAETESQVARMKAEDEVERNHLLSKAELERLTDLKNMDVQRQKEMEQIQIEKQIQLDKIAFENQMHLAKLCTENPVYASFLVNKELASKVEIAVLPTGTEPNVFGNILNNMMPTSMKNHPYE